MNFAQKIGHHQKKYPTGEHCTSFGDCSISNPLMASDTEFHYRKFFCSAGPFHVGVVVSTPGCNARGPGFKSRQKQGAKKGPVDSDFI